MPSKEISKKAMVEIDQQDLYEEARLFGILVNRYIELIIDRGIATAKTDCKSRIQLNPESDVIMSDRSSRALLQHEQAHIWFGSDVDVLKHLSKTHPEINESIIKTVYNLVEDYRIDYLWQFIFPGSRDNFAELYEKTVSNIREGLAENKSHPTHALLVARFALSSSIFELELTIGEELQNIYKRIVNELRKVEGKDITSTYIASENIIKMLKEWSEDRGAPLNGTMGGDADRILKAIPMLNDSTGSMGNDVAADADGAAIESMNASANEEEALDKSSKRMADQIERDLYGNGKQELMSKIASRMNQKDGQYGKNNSASEDANVSECYDGKANAYSGPAILPSSTIRQLLERIMMSDYGISDEHFQSGNRLDMRKLVQYHSTKDVRHILRPYVKQVSSIGGVDMWVLLDISGSMKENGKIDTAKNVLGTLCSSIGDSELILMRMFGFYENNKAHVFEFDAQGLMGLDADGGTPTHIALRKLCTLLAREDKESKPILVVITDGIPYSNIKSCNADINKETQIALKRIKDAGTEVFTIFVAPDIEYMNTKEQVLKIFAPSTAVYHISRVEDARNLLEGIIVSDLSLKANILRR